MGAATDSSPGSMVNVCAGSGTLAPTCLAVGLAMKPVGGAGCGSAARPVEWGMGKTGCCRMAQATAPILDYLRPTFGRTSAMERDRESSWGLAQREG